MIGEAVKVLGKEIGRRLGMESALIATSRGKCFTSTIYKYRETVLYAALYGSTELSDIIV